MGKNENTEIERAEIEKLKKFTNCNATINFLEIKERKN